MEKLTTEEEYDFQLSNLITEARIYAGITQEKLAQLMGTKQPSVARAETGAVKPSHGFLQRVAKAVGTILLPPKFAFMEIPLLQYSLKSDTHTVTQSFSLTNTL